MAKRYYRVQERVWIKELKKTGRVVSLDIPNLSAAISFYEDGDLKTRNMKFMEIDKYKDQNVKKIEKAIEKGWKDVKKKSSKKEDKKRKDTVLFAKVSPSAIIPSKRHEDAGYDIYANFEEDELVLKKGKANLVPTGIASSILPKYYFNLKHERGTTGKVAMSILSGVVDSGYRGQWFVNIVPLEFDVIISKTFDFLKKPDGTNVPTYVGLDGKTPEESKTVIYYPYELAIAQATLDLVPDVEVKEISYEDLKAIPSQRGTGALGSSGK